MFSSISNAPHRVHPHPSIDEYPNTHDFIAYPELAVPTVHADQIPENSVFHSDGIYIRKASSPSGIVPPSKVDPARDNEIKKEVERLIEMSFAGPEDLEEAGAERGE